MKMKKGLLALTLVVGITALSTGCVRKPYHEKVYETIAPHETGILVVLEGDNKENGQAKLKSEDYYKENLVPTKRVEIPYRWHQKGRWENDGEWIPNAVLIKVNRTPVTREWSADSNKGTSTKNEGFEAESKESIGFITGLTATASIEEKDVPTFLYQYNGKTLAEIMDTEVRGRIHSILIEEYAKMNIEEIRVDKAKVLEVVEKDVVPYFKKKGIAITNLGYNGQIAYTNPEIQKAIDRDFVAEKNKETQATINQTNEEQATSELAQAQTKAKAMETLVEMRRLDQVDKFLDTWNGVLPKVVSGDSGMIMDFSSMMND